MPLQDTFMKVLLAAGNTPVYLPLSILGFFFVNKHMFGRAVFSLCTSMVYSRLLKNIFVVLIPSSTGVGHVFPSGHMCGAVAFYGWLLINIKSKLIASAVIVLLLGLSYSLIYFHYHIWIDILGGVVFGASIVVFINYVLKEEIFETYPYSLGYFLLFIAILMLIINYFLADFTGAQLLALYILIGFSTLWMLIDYFTAMFIFYKIIPHTSMI